MGLTESVTFPIYVGIERNSNFQIFYDDIKNDPRKIDSLFHNNGKHLVITESHPPWHLLKASGMTSESWNEEIIKRLSSIADKANTKRYQAMGMLLANPFLPITTQARRALPISPMLFFFSPVFCAVCATLNIVDMAARGPKSLEEIQWLESKFSANPNLDGSFIDDEIEERMQALKDELNQNYSHLNFEFISQMKVKKERDEDIVYVDRFVLIITQNNLHRSLSTHFSFHTASSSSISIQSHTETIGN